jgi:hypothetical protein
MGPTHFIAPGSYLSNQPLQDDPTSRLLQASHTWYVFPFVCGGMFITFLVCVPNYY